MLYGKKDIVDTIMEKVKEFEDGGRRKVIFGAMVGSISKGVERYDSDYDTRFLYLDMDDGGFVRWDRQKDIKEEDIHKCYVPNDTTGFYDKIAFWEMTSFLKFLKEPILDGKFSVGLHHIVGWTLASPYQWDPYGLSHKLLDVVQEMFCPEWEMEYYINYIERCLNAEQLKMREYLYSAYYGHSLEYIIKNKRFAPVYFPTLLSFCENEELYKNILSLKDKYYDSMWELVEKPESNYKRKMANAVLCEHDSVIDKYLLNVLEESKAERTLLKSRMDKKIDKVEAMIEMISDSLCRPEVKDVNR